MFIKTCKVKASEICSCPDDVEKIQLESKASSKAIMATMPLAGFAFTAPIGAPTFAAAVFQYSKYQDEIPACVSKFGQAKEFEAKWAGLGDIKNIGLMKNLERIDLSGNISLDDIKGLDGLKKLKDLDLGYVNNDFGVFTEPESKPLNYDVVSSLKSLETLNLAGHDAEFSTVKKIVDKNPSIIKLVLPITKAFGFKCKDTGKVTSGRTLGKEGIDAMRSCNTVMPWGLKERTD
jgi:hypothetical protein